MIVAKTSIASYEAFHDPGKIDTFLKSSLRMHAHLDWRRPQEWFKNPPCVLSFDDTSINSILSLAPDPDHIHWVRFFATKREKEYTPAWTTLFSAIKEIYPFTSGDSIVSLCYQNWMETMLAAQGWQKIQKVVVLTWQGNLPGKKFADHHISVRLMKVSDLPQVFQIDESCFSACWKFSQTTITLAYEQSAYATVAEMDGRIVGFQISTSDLFRAHLTRLAVLPSFHNKGIGARLVENMLWHFSVPWIKQITVNTQHDNKASIHLYEKLGFEYRGEFFPIYQYPI